MYLIACNFQDKDMEMVSVVVFLKIYQLYQFLHMFFFWNDAFYCSHTVLDSFVNNFFFFKYVDS